AEERAARDVARRAPEQDRELILLRDDLLLQRRDRRARLREGGLRSRHLEERADAAAVAALEEVERVLERDPRLLRDLELAVQLEELEVRLRHVADERQQDAAPHGLGAEVVRAGRLRRAPDAAPDVDLPREVEGAEEHVERPGAGAPRNGRPL